MRVLITGVTFEYDINLHTLKDIIERTRLISNTSRITASMCLIYKP